MADASQLEKIAALVDRLEPLRAKRRGMPIEAEEWNALVDALQDVLEIDRAQERGVGAALDSGGCRLGRLRYGGQSAELVAQFGLGIQP